ncbi:MAG: YraN family protein [Geminicoccaceae bacterium]|nr:YraN family protein [Geminicoccaceae bacterium]
MSARRAAFARGLRAEGWAAFWLRLKGYRVLARRHRTPVGEIDLVCLKGDTLVFVEVKRRDRLDDAVLALQAVQRARLVRAAGAYLRRHPRHQGLDCRFDLVAVGRFGVLRHLKDAHRA